MKPHIHKETIIAWANGAQIQQMIHGEWFDTYEPAWDVGRGYRVKPKDELIDLLSDISECDVDYIA